MNNRTLLYVSFWHPSGGGSGVHRTARFARHLPATGWRVVVLCGPGPATHAGSAGDTPVVSTYSPFPRRVSGGTREPGSSPETAGPAARPSLLRRLLREALFLPDPQIYWIPFGLAGALRASSRTRFSAVLCSGPPFSPFILGRILKGWWNVPLVLDYRDVWIGHPWWPIPSWRGPLETRLERRLLSGADLVLANHDRMRSMFLRRNPQIADKCIVLPNGFDTEELGPPVRPAWRSGERFEIVYSGTLYGPVGHEPEAPSVQRPAGLLSALRVLQDRGLFGAGGVRATFVGAAPGTAEADSLKTCARQCGLAEAVEVLPRMDKSSTVPILRRAHLLLNIFYYTEAQVAQKLYEYLHLEIPILSLLRDSASNADVALQAGAGPVVDPADATGIAAAIEQILLAYRQGRSPIVGDRRYINQFDVRAQTRVLARSLDALTAGRPLLEAPACPSDRP